MIPRPEKPAWKGPFVDGITQSIMQRFIRCPFQFYLYAYCGLEDPKPPSPNLAWGDTLHKGLEHLVQGDTLEYSLKQMDEYRSKNYPRAPNTFKFTTEAMLKLYQEKAIPVFEPWGKLNTEVHIDSMREFLSYRFASMHAIRHALFANTPVTSECLPVYLTHSLTSSSNSNSPPLTLSERSAYIYPHVESVRIKGKADIVTADLTLPLKVLGDHKAKGKNASDAETTKKELGEDMQMNLYAFMFDSIENWIYDLILMPEDQPRTPPQRAGETAAEWTDRIFNTHKDVMNGFPIRTCYGKWLNQVPFFQSKEENLRYVEQTIVPIIYQMIDWWHVVTSPDFDPNETCWYNSVFYRAPIRTFNPAHTFKYECSYHAVLIGKADYDSLVPVKSFFSELETK